MNQTELIQRLGKLNAGQLENLLGNLTNAAKQAGISEEEMRGFIFAESRKREGGE